MPERCDSFPRKKSFFNYFEELANKIEEGGKLFWEFLQSYENPAAKASQLKEIEHEADKITHRTYEKLHKTFLTPLDREDIHILVNKMDSILDLIESPGIGLILGLTLMILVLNFTGTAR